MSDEALVPSHLAELAASLEALRQQAPRLERWAGVLATRLTAGGRLLVAGNGGSAALASHLTSELVGRYRRERRPVSAIALSGEDAAVTAIANDYGVEEVFARQVQAHAREGDVLLLLSTSGRSPNLLAAAERGRALDVAVWSMTGPLPNPLAAASDDALAVPGSTPVVQEAQQVAVHLLCELFDTLVLEG